MVTRTRLSVTLYVHCMSCKFYNCYKAFCDYMPQALNKPSYANVNVRAMTQVRSRSLIRRPGFNPRSVWVGFVVEKTVLA